MTTISLDPIAKAREQVQQSALALAATDPAFRTLLETAPHAALKQLLGVDPIPAFKINVVVEQAGEITLVLPRSITQDELPDELLDLASGGTSFSAFVEFGPNTPTWSDKKR